MKNGNEYPTILAVDDEEVNLEILSAHLEDEPFNLLEANSGSKALRMMKENSEIAIVLLDRMMPDMEGKEVLVKMREDPLLRLSQVIFQTARVMKEDVLDGMRAGANQYLKKPFTRDELMAAIHSALIDHKLGRAISEVKESDLLIPDNKIFKFRTLQDVPPLVSYLSGLCSDRDKSMLGLQELATNCIEHGLLGFSCNEKTRLLTEGCWGKAIEDGLEKPENQTRFASVSFESKIVNGQRELHFLFQDPGDGFEWKDFLDFDPLRFTKPNGRGIAMAKMLSLDRLEYQGNGNTVLAVIKG